MAPQERPDQQVFEGEPEEYRIILRRDAADQNVQEGDLQAFLENGPDDTVAPEDLFWEGTVTELETANLWELAGLVPTIEPDLYELQLKVGDNEYQFVALFGSEEDYEEVIREVTTAHPELLKEEEL